MVMPRALAIIPARGGSKRIPKKNIIDFCGRPMIGWTIEAALGSGRFSRVVVSTDSQEIADAAEGEGVPVPFLRERATDDKAPSSAATLAALEQTREHFGEDFDVVVQLMPNCPLRGSAEVTAALDHFSQRSATFQISCIRFGWTNPWWAAELEENGTPRWLFPEARLAPSQTLPSLVAPTGATWVARVPDFVREGTFYGPSHILHPMDWVAGIDIDDHDDLELARMLAKSRLSR